MATAAAKDEAAASGPQPDDSVPVATDESQMVTVNNMADATGSDDNDKNNRTEISDFWYDVPVRIRWWVHGHELLLVVELPAAQALGRLQGHLELTCLCPGLIGTLYWFYTTERAFVKF